MTRIGVLVNPTSGKRTGARFGRETLHLLRDQGIDVIDLSGRDASGALARGRAAVMAGMVDQVVVVGGDGMAHLGANICAGTDVPLGIVAAGTGNDNARGLGLPVRDAAASVARLLSGRTRRIDLARHISAHDEERWFLGVLAAGFDAIVNERGNALSWPKGPARYNVAMVRELPVFRPIRYRLELDGEPLSVSAMMVTVGNGTAYGGGMRVLPDADLHDGMLDVLILHEVSTTELLRVFPRVYQGTHVTHPRVEIRRARQVRIEAPRIVTYADGERFTPLPMTVEAVSDALTVLA